MPGLFFYTIIIGFASGIFTRSFFDIGSTWVLLFLTISIACACVWRIKAVGFYSPLFLTSLAVLSFACGVFRMGVIDGAPTLLRQYEGADVMFAGTVMREPDIRANSVQLYMREEKTGDLVLILADRFKEFSYGDYIEVQGTLKKPEAFETDLGRIFNYEKYLKARGVTYVIPFATVVVREQKKGNQFLTHLYEGKHVFLEKLESVIPEPAVGLGEGLLLGVKRALGDDLEAIFRQVGIIHIVVLSGYNIMIVVESVMQMLSFVFFPRTRMLIGICVIATFALLVGLSATVLRASIMAGMVLVARATGRTYAITRALMLAGFGMLLLNPYLLAFDPGFQLSFLATLGLIVIAPRIDERLTRIPSVFGMREFLTATLATQIIVLPLLLYQMGMFSFVAIFANVLVLPMVPYAMLLVFLTGVSSFVFSGLALIAGFGAYLALSYILVIAEFLSKIPYAWVAVPAFPFWVAGLLYCVLAGVLVYTDRKHVEEKISNIIPVNNYADWTIVEEKVNDEVAAQYKSSPEALCASGEPKDKLPFR